MNYPSVRFVFDRKHKASKNSKGLVQVEVLFMRRRKWIGTGIHLYKNQWDDKRHVINSPTVIEDNETLDTIMRNVKEIIHGIIKETGSFTFALFSSKIDRAKQRESFVDFFAKEAAKDARSKSRKSQYVSAYAQFYKHGNMVTFEDVTLEGIEKMHKNIVDNESLKINTVRNYHLIIRSVIDLAVKKGYILHNPYDDFEMPQSDNTPRCYLTLEELRRFEAVEVKRNAELYRDFFLVQCYTGLSFSDLLSFNRDCTEKRGDKVVILGQRIKTGVDYYIVLMKRVQEILEKYNYKFPMMSIKNLNYNLRRIAYAAGIGKGVTSHIGRHTFAVLALSNGMSIETVAKILGHTDIKTTQIYAKIVDKTVEESFDTLENALWEWNNVD